MQTQSIAIILFTLFFCTGCIEQSVVVKVKKDGSGIVHVRYHVQKVQVLGQSNQEDSETLTLDDPRVQSVAQHLGEGVTPASVYESKNRSGWNGYDIIFAFNDINKLKIDSDVINHLRENKPSAFTDADTDNDDKTSNTMKLSYEFQMLDQQLVIRSMGFAPDSTRNPAPTVGAIDPFASEPVAATPTIDVSSSMTDQIAKSMMADLRMGVFVEIDGKIKSTNAAFQRDNLLTLCRFDFGRIMKNDKNFQAFRVRMENQKNATRSEARELSSSIDGFDLDLGDPIQVLFK